MNKYYFFLKKPKKKLPLPDIGKKKEKVKKGDRYSGKKNKYFFSVKEAPPTGNIQGNIQNMKRDI